jgi:hypothetical protein
MARFHRLCRWQGIAMTRERVAGMLSPDSKTYATGILKPRKESEVPYINVKLIEGVFTPAQKREIAEA